MSGFRRGMMANAAGGCSTGGINYAAELSRDFTLTAKGGDVTLWLELLDDSGGAVPLTNIYASRNGEATRVWHVGDELVIHNGESVSFSGSLSYLNASFEDENYGYGYWEHQIRQVGNYPDDVELHARGNIWSLTDYATEDFAPDGPPAGLDMIFSDSTFSGLFSDMSILRSAVLPASVLVNDAGGSDLQRIFYYATGLREIHIMDDVNITGTYEENLIYFFCPRWVFGVPSTGKFYMPKEFQLQYGPSFIPEGWDVIYNN